MLFVDPFGLALNRATLERILNRSSSYQPIDVIYHFSISAVARMGRAAVLSNAGAIHNAAQIEDALGVIRWRAAFRRADTPNAPTEAALHAAHMFGDSVAQSTGVRSTAVEVRQRPGQLPKYLLMLFSRVRQAHWDFADQAAKAYVDWLHHCDQEDFRANTARLGGQGVLEIFAATEPAVEDAESSVRTRARGYLPRHLTELLQERGAVRPIDAIGDFYGQLLGQARVTHLRAALKELHDQGLIDDDCKRDFWNRQIRWTGS